MTFADLGLHRDIQSALRATGLHAPFPVQAQAIPLILQGKDLVIQAQTGSGKTITFLASLMTGLLNTGGLSQPKGPRILVLVPTRELAIQIAERAVDLVRHLPTTLRIRTAFGGVSINPQMMDLRGGAEILVATPGRLLDLHRQNAVSLGELTCLVLDEADRMLDQGFSAEMDEIRALLPSPRQTLLFSATMNTAVSKVVNRFLTDPAKLLVETDEALSLDINETVYLVEPERKGPVLRELLEKNDWAKVLIFVNSADRADKVIRKLANNGIEALAIHGQKSQGARTEAMERFKGKVRVLVATDILARGIDLTGLPCVINYELPRSPRDYTHRIGRTGRAGQSGLAITLVSPEEEQHLELVEKVIDRSLDRSSFGS